MRTDRPILREFRGHNFVSGLRVETLRNVKNKKYRLKTTNLKNFFQK